MLKTNSTELLKQKVSGEIIHPELWVERNYVTTWDGRPKLTVGIGGIIHNVKLGDPIFGWYADHLNPGVAVSNKNENARAAFNGYSCIGNKMKIASGDAKAEEGCVIGKSYFFAGRTPRVIGYFTEDILSKLTIGDKIEVEAYGTGLEIEGYEDVRVLSVSPNLLEQMDIKIKNGKLQIPVTMILPGELMGVGVGRGVPEIGSWDIQSCSPELVKKYNLEKLRFGDIVAVRDVNSDWGYTVYEGGTIIGVVSHGPSEIGGHGPGICVIFSTKQELLDPKIDEKANIGHYLDLLPNKKW